MQSELVSGSHRPKALHFTEMLLVLWKPFLHSNSHVCPEYAPQSSKCKLDRDVGHTATEN